MPIKEKILQLWGKRSAAAQCLLDGTIRGLEASKDTVVAAVPVPGLGIALNVAIEILKKIQAAETNNKELRGLCEEVNALKKILEDLAEMIHHGLGHYLSGSPERQAQQEAFENSKLCERVLRLQRDLGNVLHEAEKLSKRSTFSRFVHSGGDAKTVTDMRDKISLARHNFEIEGDIRTEALVTETLSDIKTVIAKHAQEEEKRVLDTIPRAHDAPYISATNALKARFQEGTRDDVFRDLEQWEEEQFGGSENYARPVCVLVGEAGTGKSTIASEFAKRLTRRGHLGASFFFNRGVQDLNSPRKFFSTISSQLAQSQSALRHPIIDAAQEHHKVAILQQLEHECRDLLDTPLTALAPSHPPILIVVDALDECTDEGPELVPTLLRLLLACATRPGSPLRVFLTSRPEPQYIHNVYATPELEPHILTFNIQKYRHSLDSDIKLLICGRLSEPENERSRVWFGADPSIIPKLVTRANGLFIYARTAIDFILGDLSAFPERYDVVMSDDASFGLAPLHKLYRDVLEAVFPAEERYPRRQKNLQLVLGYLVAIQVSEFCPVSPNTLESLTGMPTADSIPILNALRSVVFFERDNPQSPFSIIHATFREFLADRTPHGDAFYVDAVPVHEELVKACAETLTSFQINSWPRSESSGRRSRSPSPGRRSRCPLVGPDRLKGDYVSHVYYAYENLAYHCSKIDPESHLHESPDVRLALQDSQLYHDQRRQSFRQRLTLLAGGRARRRAASPI